MATKFKEYFDRMLETEKELFEKFQDLHDRYSLNQESMQDIFNQEGEKIMKVIREWEAKLCSQSEKAGYGGYTSNLSEKFWGEVRNKFPMIDFIGVISKTNTIQPAYADIKSQLNKQENLFKIKKINLQ